MYGAVIWMERKLVSQRAGAPQRQDDCEQEPRMASIKLARIRGRAGDLPGEELAARQLVNEAEWAADQRGTAEALGALGHSLGWQGRFAEAEDVFMRSVGLSTAAGQVSAVSRSLALLAALDACQGHLVSARKRWAQAVVCSPPHDSTMSNCGAFLAFLAGDLAMVRMHAEQAEIHDPETQLSKPRRWGALAVIAAVERGRITEARRGLDGMARPSRDGDLHLSAPLYWWAEGVVAWAEGWLTDATAILQRAVGGYSAIGASALVGLILADLAEVAVAAGDSPTAAHAATQAEASARHAGTPGHQALGWFAMAWALLGRGRHEEAARAALRAVSGFGSSGYALLVARAQVAYASAVRHHDRSAAVGALREAVAVFEQRGATLRQDQAHRLLIQLQSEGSRAADARSRPAALTTRERQVAELAARGYTARQIADRLNIGTRTAETHLRRIYPKLGVTCKQELVRRTVEFGFNPDS